MNAITIRDPQDVENAVLEAIASKEPVEIIGHGSKRTIGQPTKLRVALDVSSLNTVTSYEPSELFVSAQAGAPVVDVISLVESQNQQFSFEPVNMGPLLGTNDFGTIGGMLGTGFAGPRRVKAGGVRDHLLGAIAISGFGTSFKVGGKVVKNVTGYDLCKLLTGSWGTLAVTIEATMRVTPAADSQRTLVLRGLDDLAANRAMTTALSSPFDVSGAAHLPKSTYRSRNDGLDEITSESGPLTLLRVEGVSVSTIHRAESLRQLLKPLGATEITEDVASVALWRSIRDAQPFARKGALGAWQVWRIVCPPASGGALGQALVRETGGEATYDWGGGLIWLAVPNERDAQAGLVRRHVEAARGHATLIRAAEDVRRDVDVFQPQPIGIAALSERIRCNFDPEAILNRGRLNRGAVL
jgi:glycolate oxidase FAD binding subunit